MSPFYSERGAFYPISHFRLHLDASELSHRNVLRDPYRIVHVPRLNQDESARASWDPARELGSGVRGHVK